MITKLVINGVDKFIKKLFNICVLFYLINLSRRRSSVVEQLTRNQQAVGSIPTAGSTKKC